MSPVVAGVSGQCSDNTSAVRHFVERGAHRADRSRGVGFAAPAATGTFCDQDAHAETGLRGLRDRLAQRAESDDTQDLAGQFAERRARHRKLLAARPGSIDGSLAVFAQAVGQCQHDPEHVLHHRNGAVVADVAHRDAEFARGFEVDVVGAGGRETDEPQSRDRAHACARDLQLVGEDELASGDALVDLGVGGSRVQRDAGQDPLQHAGVEVVVADRAEIQKYRAHP